MSTGASICFSAVCLILVAQVSSAYEIKPCKGFKGKLHSFEVHNCPDKKAEYCELELNREISFDAKYTAGVSYEKAWTGFIYDEGLMVEHDHCKDQPLFCPGKAGQEQSYHFKFNISVVLPEAGIVRPLKIFTQPKIYDDYDGDFVVCAEFPAKFVYP